MLSAARPLAVALAAVPASDEPASPAAAGVP